MNSLIDRVACYSAQHQLWAPDVRVVAAVSGGSDSVALLFLLKDLADRGELVLAGLAHLHHRLRGDDADRDAVFCRDLASRLGVPAVVGEADVSAEARDAGVSIEVAGRQARQRFYLEASASLTADRVALAHTRDDQAETLLLRLTRGAGSLGLAAMAPRRAHLVRPVLDLSRAELQQFLRDRGETWREDATNSDRAIPRNLIRHDVLPYLRTLNPRADEALARAAELLRADAAFLEQLANAAFIRAVEVDEAHERVTISADELSRLPAPLASRVARYALETANPSRAYGLEEAQALCAFAASGNGARDVPGLEMERFGAKVVLRSRATQRVPRVPQVVLQVPGVVEVPHGQWVVEAAGPMPVGALGVPRLDRVVVDARDVGGHLIVRTRRPGDRLQPLGAPGRKKVQDVLVDRKVPRDDRDQVPIVTTEKGQIVWVAGQVLAEPFRVTPLTTTVVVLTLRRV